MHRWQSREQCGVAAALTSAAEKQHPARPMAQDVPFLTSKTKIRLETETERQRGEQMPQL
jgi:hypothetical protein